MTAGQEVSASSHLPPPLFLPIPLTLHSTLRGRSTIAAPPPAHVAQKGKSVVHNPSSSPAVHN